MKVVSKLLSTRASALKLHGLYTCASHRYCDTSFHHVALWITFPPHKTLFGGCEGDKWNRLGSDIHMHVWSILQNDSRRCSMNNQFEMNIHRVLPASIQSIIDPTHFSLDRRESPIPSSKGRSPQHKESGKSSHYRMDLSLNFNCKKKDIGLGRFRTDLITLCLNCN